MSARTCPDWPELMELDPDLQFKHYTVAEAQLPAEVALAHLPRVARRGRDLLRPRAPRLQPGHTDLDVAEALRGTHWFDVREWATSGPGRTAERQLLERRPDYASPRAGDRHPLPR